MSRFMAWIDGSKTNLVSIWTFGGAIFLVMNGVAIDEETAAIVLQDGAMEFSGALTVFAGGLSALRSSNAKIQNLVKSAALPMLAFGVSAACVIGCAGLGQVGPDGQTVGQAIATEAGNLVGVFAPGTSMLVSGGVSSLMSLLTLIGKAANPVPNPT